MKAFIVLDGNSRPIAATTTEETAFDVIFTKALQEGRVDEATGTFDFGDNSILDVDLASITDSMFFTPAELEELQEKGAVLV